jgi:hypothetical protein
MTTLALGKAARTAAAVGAVLALFGMSRGSAQETSSGAHCSSTANSLLRACGFEAQDDYWKAVARCTNVSESTERADCFAEAKTARNEKSQQCRDQHAGRLDACRLLGESRYDPEFDAEAFDGNFANLTHRNPYFPLTIGYRWEYQGGTEAATIEVLNQTKLIDNVTCIVIRDLVRKNGRLAEAADDWFAQAKDGNVWYCGEEVKNYETFRGDRPRAPELVSIDGSFKAGRNRDKPGIIFRANPHRGDVYLEEFSLGNAEDVTEILSTSYRFGADSELDRFVPRRLAAVFCAGDCVVTKNYSLLEPGVFARKYYAPGIGVILEVKPDTQEVLQLTNCNFDPRCANLPRP